ncbi:MAG: molybdate ABC transporter permease subunit [Planctomycetales bacterium]
MEPLAWWLSIKLAACTTLILLVVGLPVAYWLSQTQWRGKFLLEAVLSLPLVLPASVLGFYILQFTSPRGAFGGWIERVTGSTIPFTFNGILLASVIYNIPHSIRPFLAAFQAVDRRLCEASWCLGVSRFETFRRVIVPLAWPGILAGLILTFAHTLGEFGIVLMVGGNIPGVTRTLSITIYDDVHALDYASAGRTAFCLLAVSFVVLCATHWLQRKPPLP